SAQPNRTQPPKNENGNRPSNAYPSRTDRPMTNAHDAGLERTHQQEQQSWRQQQDQQRQSVEQKHEQQMAGAQRPGSQRQERETQQLEKKQQPRGKEEQRHKSREDRPPGR